MSLRNRLAFWWWSVRQHLWVPMLVTRDIALALILVCGLLAVLLGAAYAVGALMGVFVGGVKP